MLVLPEGLRDEVRQPFGKVVSGKAVLLEYKKAEKPLITVGDQCFLDAAEAGFVPDIGIFDFKIKRKEIPIGMKRRFAQFIVSPYVVLSSAGSITEELERAVLQVLEDGKGAVLVVGEDDLSSLLVMAHASKGTLIYGQPDAGAVVVELGSKMVQGKAKAVLSKMDSV